MSSSPSKDRELFGTLLASKPRRSRSWKSLGIAIVVHVALVTIAIITFKPFQPRPEQEDFQPLTVMIVEDDAVQEIPSPFANAAAGAPQEVAAAAPSPRRKQDELIYRPGPLAPIVTDPNAAETAEPDENGISGEAEGGSLSGRLLPRGGDPRITAPTAFPQAEKTGVEAVRERISGRLSVFNDSVAADAAARYTDWTLTSKDGTRWGVTTDTIYLGSIKIPTKRVAFSPPAGKRDEIAARNRDFAEIEKQAMLEESRSSFKERVQSIRARKDAERAARKRKTEDSKPITESR
jgi:hypothetical protein